MGSVNTVDDKLVLKVKIPKKIKVRDSHRKAKVKRYNNKCESGINEPCYFDPPCFAHRKRRKSKITERCWICRRAYISKVAFKKHLMTHLIKNSKGKRDVINDTRIRDYIRNSDIVVENQILEEMSQPIEAQAEPCEQNIIKSESETENGSVSKPEFETEEQLNTLLAGNYKLPDGVIIPTKEQLDALVFFQNYITNNPAMPVNNNVGTETSKESLNDLEEACKLLNDF